MTVTSLHTGRDFSETEGLHGAKVLVVNRTMARTLWPLGQAIGQEVIIGDEPLRIIGVVADVRHSGLGCCWPASPRQRSSSPA